MQVTVIFLGPLAQQIGQESVPFDLPQGAVYGDLLDDMACRFGDKLHERYWDRKAICFKAQILVMGTGRDYIDRSQPLVENEILKVVPFLAGG